jgi:hypothetical protein
MRLVEFLVTAAITLALAAGLFSMVQPAHGMTAVQPEIGDMQQRMRIAMAALSGGIVMAGAGVDRGSVSGSLGRYFAPVLPYRAGRFGADPPSGIRYRSDAITILHVPKTAAQSRLRDRVATGATTLTVDAWPGCPVGDPACGFAAGMTVLVFDETSAWDGFEVTGVEGATLQVEHLGPGRSHAYEPGAAIAEAIWHTYYLDDGADQLRHYDGQETDVPVVDNVVGLRFTYFGAAEPPSRPTPPAGVENCVADSSGASKLPVLPTAGASLAELSPEVLSDGGAGAIAWCGTSDHLFDPDLLRIRKVRITVRVQAGTETLRGADAVLFRNPGRVRRHDRLLPDIEATIDVTPRNLAPEG